MEIIKTKTICDVCKEETNNKETDIQVIFTTEPNESRWRKNHLYNEKLDLCDKCLTNVLYNGNYIYVNGDMGYNTYFFRKIEESDSDE